MQQRLMAANYWMVLPDAEVLQMDSEKTRRLIESRITMLPKKRKR